MQSREVEISVERTHDGRWRLVEETPDGFRVWGEYADEHSAYRAGDRHFGGETR